MSDEKIVLSPSLTYHEHHGAYYVYHNRVGYLLKMSHDVLGFLEAFRTPMTEDDAVAHFDGTYPGAMVRDFLGTFRQHLCLLGERETEDSHLWSMFPVRSRWLVYRAPADPSEPLRFVHVGPDRETHVEEVSGWRRTLWEMIDGNQSLSALIAMLRRHIDLEDEPDLKGLVTKTLNRWVGVDLQILRLSPYPASIYKQQPHLHQPYLTSLMPYALYRWGDPVTPSLEEQREVTPTAYYAKHVKDARAQFDDVETTLSHLFRVPNPVLGGKSYGAKMAEKLIERGNLPEHIEQVVEVGGGLGVFAKAFLGELLERRPELEKGLRYRIVDVSPVLQAAQREELGDYADRVSFQEGDAEHVELDDESVDLLITNEVVGDLRGVRLTRVELGLDGEDEEAGPNQGELAVDAPYDDAEERVLKLGEPGELIVQYNIPLQDAPHEFYLNVGLFLFLERIWKALRPGGAAVITEFGEEHGYPQLSMHLDHPELSIHFGHARHVARRLGFDVEFSYILDLLDFDRDAKTLAATRSSFIALQEMLRSYGVELDKLAYTEDMLRAAIADKVPFEELHELEFEPIDDRCLGLVPHQFKALILRKPASA